MADEKTIELELPESLTKLGDKLDAIAASIAKLEGGGSASSPTFTSDLATLKAEFVKVEKELANTRAELQKQFEDTTKELVANREEVLKVRAARRREQFIRRVGKLSHLPGAPADDFAEILDTIEAGFQKVAPEKATVMFSKLDVMLNSWNAIVEKSKLFSEMGKEGGPVNFSGAEGVLHAMAKERASADKIPYNEAYAKVLKENPDIYQRYRAEKES